MFHTLRDFLDHLSAAGELKRISAPVSPVLEIAAITDRVSKSPAPVKPAASAQRTDPRFHHLGGPALLFENVQGSDFPVAINTFGSYTRTSSALNARRFGDDGLESIAAKIGALTKPEPPQSLGAALAKLRELAPLLRIPPKRRRGLGLCHEVVHTGDEVDLTRLPIIRCWPLDGDLAAVGYPVDVNDRVPGLARGADWDRDFRGRYITLGGVHTIHADDRDNPKPPSHNIGMYRAQLLAKDKLAMHWHIHHDGARHWRSWKELGKPMPVAIALGGESVLPYAATAPLPPGMSELLLAGFLHGKGIDMVRARTVPLWVPANAEIIIEGYVSHEAGPIGWDPRASSEPLGPGAVFEGPFGDHTGFYSMPDRYPIFHVTAITHRRDPIYPTTIVGLPPQEDYFLGKATERIFLPLLRTMVPDIEDYDLPLFGAFHNCAFVKIRKSYPMHARRIMHAIWGAGQMSWTKSVFVVDHDVDVHDARAVLEAAASHCDPMRDIERAKGPLDILDHAAALLGAGTKLGFDCTRPIAGEGRELSGSEHPEGLREEASNGGSEKLTPRSTPVGQTSHPSTASTENVSQLIDQACQAGRLTHCREHHLHARGWLFLQIDKQQGGRGGEGAETIEQAIASLGDDAPPYLAVVHTDVDITNLDDCFFHLLAHTDLERDLYPFDNTRTLAIDATPKLDGDERRGLAVRPWPPLITLDAETRNRIRSSWSELSLS